MGVTATPTLLKPRADDRYPSRFGSQVRITERLDPVVYGTADSGPLNEQQLHFYENNGFLHFDSLLTPAEVKTCLDEVHRLRADEAVKDTEQAIVEPDSREMRSLF